MTYEVKIMTNEQIANTIRDILEVSKELVGIKTWKEAPTTVQKYQAWPAVLYHIFRQSPAAVFLNHGSVHGADSLWAGCQRHE